MIGFNHAAVGGLLATFLPLPVALPLAFLSHFVLDTFPHYGIPHNRRNKSIAWRVIGTLDFILAIAIIGGLSVFVWHRYDILLCGLAAASPDFVWVARIIRTHSFDLSKNETWFTRMHVAIQQFERPWGIYLEVPIAVVLFWLLQESVAAVA